MHISHVIGLDRLSPDIFSLVIERLGLPFRPGQAFAFTDAEGLIERSFSVASGVRDEFLRFIIRSVPGGFSERLSGLSAGDEVRIGGPRGQFFIGQDDSSAHWVYICTSTGVAPLLSFMRSCPERPPARLLFGVKRFSDAVDFDALAAWCDARIAVSREEAPGRHRGRVTDFLDDLPHAPDTHYYLCGLDAMLRDVRARLVDCGVAPDHIHVEVFFRAR